jgi:periplasmic protein TorT
MKRSAIASGAVAAGALLALASLGAYAQSKKWYPFSVEEHNPPFDMSSPVKEVMYTPLEKADKKWNICVSFPHMKDAYWLAVDYGVSEEAKDLG